MDSKQINKEAMYRSVAKVGDDHAALTATVVAYGRQLAALKSTCDTVDALAQAQEASRTGIAVDKSRITEILIGAVLAVAGGVAAWASENSNEEVRAKVNFAPTDLRKLRDAQIPERARMVAEEAGKHDLSEHGVGPLVIDGLRTKIAAYDAIVSAPRDAQIKTKGLTQALAEQFKLGDKILSERLDKLMEQFREPQPQFYRDYHNARTIVDRGGSQSGPSANPPSSKPATP